MNSQKIQHREAMKFILGGKSTFTLKNPRTLNRLTYNVNKHKNDDIYFAKVLTGPSTWSFIGTIRPDGNFQHSKKSLISKDSQSVKVLDFVTNRIKMDRLPEFIEIWHEGKCCKCGRPLTDPESIKIGMGPNCRTK